MLCLPLAFCNNVIVGFGALGNRPGLSGLASLPKVTDPLGAGGAGGVGGAGGEFGSFHGGTASDL